ncbi:hypothetical protein [Pleurocapsa sp. PCC 7319]|uniref:hypothetical protein n=1 Tax=Pleurocapsa sp. PCC 7319 TaxID=118161 RepID=UPI000373FC63|nr:hypothetical protein [Pleurocapsa sp. PCC 7319]
MTNINRQEVAEYLADYNVPEFLIDLICEDESGEKLVRGWHQAELEFRFKVLSAIERLDLYADGRRIEHFIWDAVSEHPRSFISHEIEYLKSNSIFRSEIVFWYESNNSDGCWSDENVKLIQEFQRQAAVEKVLADAELFCPIWDAEQYRDSLGISEIEASEMIRISKIEPARRTVEEWRFLERIWQVGYFQAVTKPDF